jgi:hypothetical protein
MLQTALSKMKLPNEPNYLPRNEGDGFFEKGIAHGKRTTRTQAIEGRQRIQLLTTTAHIKDTREQGWTAGE